MNLKQEFVAIWKSDNINYNNHSFDTSFKRAINHSLEEVAIELFDHNAYLRDYPDVRKACMPHMKTMLNLSGPNPVHVLTHFLRVGRSEKRKAYCIRKNGEKVLYRGLDFKEYIRICENAYHSNINNELHGYIHYLNQDIKPKLLTIKENVQIFTEPYKNAQWVANLKQEWIKFNAWNYKAKHGKTGSAKELFVDYLSSFTLENVRLVDEKKVLVVMPTYNRAQWIETRIEHIINQTCTNWTFLIIDDGSTPENKFHFQLLKQKYSNQEKILFMENERNKHIAYTLNKGIRYFHEHQEFTHFTWISDDNDYYPDYLEKLQEANAEFAYGYYAMHYTNTGSERVNKFQYTGFDHLLNNFNGCAAFMWSKSAMRKAGMYTEGIPGCEDYEYLLRTFKCVPMEQIKQVKKSLMRYKIHSESSFEKEKDRILKLKDTIVACFTPLPSAISNDASILNSNGYKSNEKELSIIILCHNHLEYTKQCIESVIRNICLSEVELIIVNNASSDGTKEYLDAIQCQYVNQIQIIHNTSNFGFSKGMNIGVNKSSGKYIILLNNDTVVTQGWSYELISILKRDTEVFAVTPITSNSGNESRIELSHNNPQEFFTKYNDIKSILPSTFQCNSLGLFCGAFRREDFCRIGYLDETYLNGWEDDDLYERIRLMCKKVVISTQSVVYHFGNITVGRCAYSSAMNTNKQRFETKWNKKWGSHYTSAVITDNSTDMIPYQGTDHVKEYIMENYNKNWMLTRIPTTENSIQIDPHIYTYINDVKLQNVYRDIHDNGVENGAIYSINQFKNHFELDKDAFYKKGESYFCMIKNRYVDLKLLAKDLYSKSFEYYINDIKVIENCLNIEANMEEAICSYIGNYTIGFKLIQKIVASGRKHTANIFIFKNIEDYTCLQEVIAMFPTRIVFKCKEYGTDIIPTLQTIHAIKQYNINYIYKLHTKTDNKWFDECTDYLLQTPPDKLKSTLISKNKNCIGHKDYYLNIHHSSEVDHCQKLKQKYSKLFDKTDFIKGSMFFCNIAVFTTILKFIQENNYQSYFLNNCYDTNIVNFDNSPIHFLERLFGIIRLTE